MKPRSHIFFGQADNRRGEVRKRAAAVVRCESCGAKLFPDDLIDGLCEGCENVADAAVDVETGRTTLEALAATRGEAFAREVEEEL